MPRRIAWISVGVVSLIGIAIFFYFVRSFSPAQRYTLFFINKATAETAILLIGLSFLLGPLCKIFPFISRYLYFRRYFGLVGFVTVLVHIVLSLLQFTSRFPLKWYFDHIWGVVAAIVSTVIFLILALSSSNKVIQKLGGKQWKTVQRLGYAAVIFALIHIGIASYSRWMMWLGGKVTMPNSFVVFVFGVIVIIARLLALIIDKGNNYTKHNNPKVSDTSHHGLYK